MKNEHDPAKVLHVNIGPSCTERLVALLGGYTEGMSSLLIEPEAVKDFLDYFADFTMKFIDLVCGRYPVNLMTFHDDWGTERDTFFSEQVMEEIVYEPTKRIIDHIKSRGAAFELHSCGNIMRFVPYMIDMGIDFIQIQRRAVDIPALKIKYGDRIGIDAHIEGLVYFEQNPPIEEYLQRIRKTVDLYAKKGGFITAITGDDPQYLWDAVFEL
jgi:uroporphyrinogen-III decarboxylase